MKLEVTVSAISGIFISAWVFQNYPCLSYFGKEFKLPLSDEFMEDTRIMIEEKRILEPSNDKNISMNFVSGNQVKLESFVLESLHMIILQKFLTYISTFCGKIFSNFIFLNYFYHYFYLYFNFNLFYFYLYFIDFLLFYFTLFYYLLTKFY